MSIWGAAISERDARATDDVDNGPRHKDFVGGEWIRIDTIDDEPGVVELPDECAAAE